MDSTRKNGDAVKSPPWGKVVSAAARDKRLSEMHYRTLIAISSHASWKNHGGEIGEAWPVFATVERVHGIAKGTLSRCVGDLASWGYLQIEKRPNPSGGRKANRYLLPLNVEVPQSADLSKIRSLRTSECTELRTSIHSERSTSARPELGSSNGRNINREQTFRTDQCDQSEFNKQQSHTHATTAASQTSLKNASLGMPIENLANHSGRIVLEIGMRAPDFVFKEYRTKVGLGKTAWVKASAELRENVWGLFLAAKAGRDWSVSTVSGEFTKWVRAQIGRRFDGTPCNADPIWRAFDDPHEQKASPIFASVAIIGNMPMQDWALKFKSELEDEDCKWEWQKWTLDNHGKKLTLLEANISWSRYVAQRCQYLARREAMDIQY